MSWQDLKGFENDYEIFTEYPYPIKKKANNKIVQEWDNGDVYRKVKLNKRDYFKHVIVAKQFIDNDDPEHKTYVDHINHDRTDYSIENLRWVTHSDNCKNKSSHMNVKYEFVDELPYDCVIIDHYNNHMFDEKIYFSVSEDKFYKEVAPSYYRIMHKEFNKTTPFVLASSNKKKLVKLYFKKVISNIDMYEPIDDL